MDSEDRNGLLILGTILASTIVLPLLILEAPWLLALAMLLLAGYWWQTGNNPANAALDSIRNEPNRERTAARRDHGDPLAVLRERYARGEISDEEFEQRLDRLLVTEPDALVRDRERSFER